MVLRTFFDNPGRIRVTYFREEYSIKVNKLSFIGVSAQCFWEKRTGGFSERYSLRVPAMEYQENVSARHTELENSKSNLGRFRQLVCRFERPLRNSSGVGLKCSFCRKADKKRIYTYVDLLVPGMRTFRVAFQVSEALQRKWFPSANLRTKKSSSISCKSPCRSSASLKPSHIHNIYPLLQNVLL